MIDPRNRPALFGSLIAGVAAFLVLWLLGISPLLAWMVGWSLPAFAMYGAWAGRYAFRHKTQKTVFTVVLVAATILWLVIAVWAIIG